MDDYEHAMAAYRNADALDPQKSSAKPELSPAESDPQFSPSEDFFVQPAMNFKPGACRNRPATRAGGTRHCLPARSLPAVDESETIPGEPERKF